jgi:hypothetical protein
MDDCMTRIDKNNADISLPFTIWNKNISGYIYFKNMNDGKIYTFLLNNYKPETYGSDGNSTAFALLSDNLIEYIDASQVNTTETDSSITDTNIIRIHSAGGGIFGSVESSGGVLYYEKINS